MTPDQAQAALVVHDALERSRRLESDRVRSWLVSIATNGQARTTLPPSLQAAHDDKVSPELLPYELVGQALQVSSRTVTRLVRSGALPAVQVGGKPRVRRTDLDRYIAGLELVGVSGASAADGEESQ